MQAHSFQVFSLIQVMDDVDDDDDDDRPTRNNDTRNIESKPRSQGQGCIQGGVCWWPTFYF